MSDNWAYGLSGFMDAYQRARQGQQGRQVDPYVEQERYNKLSKETDDKNAEAAYFNIKNLASGGKDAPIMPPSVVPLRAPGNTGFGASRPGSLGTGSSPYMGGGQPLDRNMSPLGIPLGIMGGLGGGGGKPGAPGGAPPGPPQMRPQPQGQPPGSAPGSSAAGVSPSPAAPPPAGPSGNPPATPAGVQTASTATPAESSYPGEHPADTFSGGAAPPPMPEYQAPDLSQIGPLGERLRAAGYDDHAIKSAQLQLAGDIQKEHHAQFEERRQNWRDAMTQWEATHKLSDEQEKKVRQIHLDEEAAAKATIEKEHMGLLNVRTRQEIEKAAREFKEGDDPATKALRKQYSELQTQMADREKIINESTERMTGLYRTLGDPILKKDEAVVKSANEQLQIQVARQKAAQESQKRIRPQRAEVMKKLGMEDTEVVPEDAPPPPPQVAGPGLLERGEKALGRLGTAIFGPAGGNPQEAVVLDHNGRPMRYKGGPRSDPNSYAPAQ